MDMLNIHQLPLQHSALFALRQSAVDLMTFQTIDWNEQTSQELDFRLITISENNLSQWNSHMPLRFPLCAIMALAKTYSQGKWLIWHLPSTFAIIIHIPVSLYLTSCVPVSHVSGFHTLDVPKSLVLGPQVPSPHTRIPMSLSQFYTKCTQPLCRYGLLGHWNS